MGGLSGRLIALCRWLYSISRPGIVYMLDYMGPFLTRIRDAGVQKGAPF